MKQETDDPNLKGLGLVAIHIDHGFRSKSTQDAQHCENWAKSRSIPLVTCKIPWGEPPFPKLKSLNEHKEEMARLARMQLLFWVMQEKKASTILMAHHLDDQIETSVMRYRRLKDRTFASGITPLGLAGMRPCRRWGMGLPPKSGLGFFGAEGMNHWISRPLLEVPKSRIIQTAKDDGLIWVEDESNDDVHFTERNSIRAQIRVAPESIWLLAPQLPPYSPFEDGNHLPLVDKVNRHIEVRDEVENEGEWPNSADVYLRKHTGFGPEGTFHLVTSKSTSPSGNVRLAVVSRILRYVSPHPWGSPQAEAGRDRAKLRRIADAIWPYRDEAEEETFWKANLAGTRRKFSGGGFVLWHPTPWTSVTKVLSQGYVADTRGLDSIIRYDEAFGWLAQRQPTHKFCPATVDITEKLESREPFSVLWDCRWLLEFSSNAIDVLQHSQQFRAMARDAPERRDRYFITAGDQFWRPCVSYQNARIHKGPVLQLAQSFGDLQVPAVTMRFVRTMERL
ncbi:SubName: Full=Uncharacterized protein {ECO:0000313/EMBL:CCA72084.1} [Serendipita indica DSM 11827]|nr:SubName: Full=Uncharacterized protein {ECO:0000313/EMBL:CCA72084.1} [Serendipita indica DSM 11827]